MKKLILSSMIALAVILSGTAVSSAFTLMELCPFLIKAALDSDVGFKNTREGLRRYSDIISLGDQEVEVQAFTFISKTPTEVLTIFCQGGIFVRCDATPGVGGVFTPLCSL